MADGAGRNGPRYRQIADALRARIQAGEFPAGGKLPSIGALHGEYGVAPATVDRALEVLRKEGIAETVHGAGTYVRDPGPRRSPEFVELERQLEAAVARLGAVETRQDAHEARFETAEADVMEMRAMLGLDQPSHRQDGKARHEDVS